MRVAHIQRVALLESERLLRSPFGLVCLAFYVIWHVYGAYWLRKAAPQVGQVGKAFDTEAGAVLAEVVGWWTDLDASSIAAILDAHPPTLVAYFTLAVGIMPFMAMVLTHDQHATDIRSRHLRFLLLRVDRTSLFFGKALGHLGLLAASTAVAVGLSGLYLFGTTSGGAGPLMYLGRIWLSLVAFCVPFVALMALIGIVTARARLALVAGFGLQLLVALLALIGGAWKDDLTAIRYAFPTATKYHVISDQAADVMTGLAHQGVLALIFGGLALILLRRRDL